MKAAKKSVNLNASYLVPTASFAMKTQNKHQSFLEPTSFLMNTTRIEESDRKSTNMLSGGSKKGWNSRYESMLEDKTKSPTNGSKSERWYLRPQAPYSKPPLSNRNLSIEPFSPVRKV
jgi:hypothetical protein